LSYGNKGPWHLSKGNSTALKKTSPDLRGSRNLEGKEAACQREEKCVLPQVRREKGGTISIEKRRAPAKKLFSGERFFSVGGGGGGGRYLLFAGKRENLRKKEKNTHNKGRRFPTLSTEKGKRGDENPALSRRREPLWKKEQKPSSEKSQRIPFLSRERKEKKEKKKRDIKPGSSHREKGKRERGTASIGSPGQRSEKKSFALFLSLRSKKKKKKSKRGADLGRRGQPAGERRTTRIPSFLYHEKENSLLSHRGLPPSRVRGEI